MSIIDREAPATDPLELIPTLADEPVTRRDVLLKAAKAIERYGWSDDAFVQDKKHGFCILGAISHAAGTYSWQSDETVAYIGNVETHDVYEWNDEVFHHEGKQGKARVIDALRRMADGASWDEATA